MGSVSMTTASTQTGPNGTQSPSEPDVALTVALAEYEFIRELRKTNTDRSAARFNFYMVAASGTIAALAALASQKTDAEAVQLAAAAALGAVFLTLGAAVFVRLVQFTAVQHEYSLALNALRAYLLHRSPELKPYFLLPVLRPQDVPTRRSTSPFSGLAGTAGAINSGVVGFATGALVCIADWPAGATAITGLASVAMVFAAHAWYHTRTLRRYMERLTVRLATRTGP